MSEAERKRRSHAICSAIIGQLNVPAWLDRFEKGVLAAYIPFGHEADIVPVIEWCWSKGIRVAVPRTQPGTRQLHFHQIDAFDQTSPGTWGIREPKPETPLLREVSRIVCMLVPGVAFDERKGRLGYGGGYYDRFAEQLAQAGANPFKLAPAFDLQIVAEVPMNQHDLYVDRIVSESRLII